MFVFTNTINPRLQYITEFIGEQITGNAITLSQSKQDFSNYDGPKINYSDQRIAESELWVSPHSLLFEKTIRPQTVECFEVNGNKAFFRTEGDIPFDIFAASFYLLSRYEEYLPHQKDSYGRYAHENSLAYKNNFLKVPLINKWLQVLKASLNEKFSPFPIDQSRFTFLPTYDIDEAWSYKHKEALRTAGAVAKALLKGEWGKIARRRSVLRGKQPDPFDAYDWMDNLHQRFNLHPRYFFLMAGRTGKYDRNILPRQKLLQELIKRQASRYEIGIHPSWQSGDEPGLLQMEKKSLEEICGKPIHSSRQHYIRFSLPQTFHNLIDAGIKEDFSMGYGSINGFRASVASPFTWFDLENEKSTGLRLFPFCFMEANSFFELKQTPLQAFDEIKHYYKQVKEVQGTFISIWHNSFLGTDPMFGGWREMYEQFITGIA